MTKFPLRNPDRSRWVFLPDHDINFVNETSGTLTVSVLPFEVDKKYVISRILPGQEFPYRIGDETPAVFYVYDEKNYDVFVKCHNFLLNK